MINVDKWSSANPWLGLASYTEGTPLFGRDKETEVLTDIIKNNLATIVFGKSGVGKSSLLGAGISPALREEMYIPVKIRLVHNSDVSYVEQIEEEVRKQVNCSDMLPDSVISLGLWDFFHRHNFYRKEDGEECTPVVILDQFEEIYTLTDEEHKPDIHIFFQELSSLLNDIKPDHIIEKEREYASSSPTTLVGDSKLKIKRVAASSLSYSDGINFRFVICLREDKLYLLERNSVNIPVLKANRFNLQALSIESAFAVIACPRPDLFTKAEAYAIIDKLADMGDEGVRTVDPAILSLFLYKYYEKRGTASADNIFADYYSEATKGISNRSIVFLENHLLTLGGYRNQIPLYDALSTGVTEEEIRSLFSNVILRTEKRKGIDYIEFSHDRLCAEAKKNREERTMHEQARKARRRMMISVAIFAISSTMLSIVLWLTFKYRTSEEGRLSEIQQKEQLKIKNDSLALLDAMNKRQTDSLIVLNENNSIQKERIEQQRDEINKSLQKQQEQNKLLKEQLATIEEQQQEIEGLRSLASVDSIVIQNNIAGELANILPYHILSRVSKLTVTGELNEADIVYIKNALDLGNLKHLDLGKSNITQEDASDKLVFSYATNYSEAKTTAESLETITLPQNMKKLSESAFRGARNLRHIIIPNSVSSIGDNAFEDCSSLTSITIPDSVTSIGKQVFSGCHNLKSINLPNDVTSIGFYAFAHCQSLESITIPDKVTSIESSAFTDCSSLKSITIPKSVKDIGYGVFSDCDKLSSIVVEKGNPVYDSRSNCNGIIETSTNELIVGCSNTMIPKSVISIGRNAFEGYGSASITIPNSVTTF